MSGDSGFYSIIDYTVDGHETQRERSAEERVVSRGRSLRADVYFDVLCPWSFIAKRRLETALSLLPDRVEVVWRSVELAPGNRRTPGPTAAEKMTGWTGDRAAARIDLIRRLGAAEGLVLDLHRTRPVDTFDAHRVLHLAAARGKTDAMLELLLAAYHTDGLNVADPLVLERLGTMAGPAAGRRRLRRRGQGRRGERRRTRRHRRPLPGDRRPSTGLGRPARRRPGPPTDPRPGRRRTRLTGGGGSPPTTAGRFRLGGC